MSHSSRPASRRGSDSGESQRQLRVGELLRHSLAELFLRDELRDPALVGVSVTVTEVRVSPDLRHARAYVLPLGGGHAPEVIEALNRSARYVRGRVAKTVKLRYSPDIVFVIDESFDRARHIDDLLKDPKVARDLTPEDEPSPPEEIS